MSRFCFGIDIGGTTIKMGVFTEEGRILHKWEIPTRTEDNGRYILKDVADSINNIIIERNIDRENILGIGIGVPGPVTADGTVLKCVNLGWDIFNVADTMKNLTGFSTRVNNDANVAALGEMWRGGGKGYKSIIMVTLGTGVGGGVIINGEIVTGSRGAAGEIGHLSVNFNETRTCGCGNKGCLEQYASATGIVNEAKKLLASRKEDSLLRSVPELTAKDIFDCAKKEDALALELVDQLGRYLGISLGRVATVVDPEAFVIGGGVSKAGDILINAIKKHYNTHIMFALEGKEFKLAELGNDAGIYGAAKMILRN